MYRQLQDVRDRMNDLQLHTHNAFLAEDTRVMTQEAGMAQVMADEMGRLLTQGLQTSAQREPSPERTFSVAARDALQSAVTEAQRVQLGTNVQEIRAGLLVFKTFVDFADAYLRAAMGDVGGA